MTPPQKNAALLIGHGGPRNPEEVRPFMDSVLEGVKIPSQRYDAVLHHYETFGGVSPYNRITERQKEALTDWFHAQSISIPIEAAFRHSTPTLKDAFESFKKNKVQRVLGFVLTPFRCFSSFEKYQNKVLEAMTEVEALDMDVVYTGPFDGHPLYWEAQAARANENWQTNALVVFTAHSVPLSPDLSTYEAQYSRACQGIAALLSLKPEDWTMAYQSRSGNPRDRWLEPDIKDVIGRVDVSRHSKVFVIPVGFLSDNMEVLYDLDVEAKELCLERGLEYHRAATVGDDPRFIEMMGRQFEEKLLA